MTCYSGKWSPASDFGKIPPVMDCPGYTRDTQGETYACYSEWRPTHMGEVSGGGKRMEYNL